MTAPALNIPASASTVSVAVIDSTTDITVPASLLMAPSVPGFEVLKPVKSFSFLVEHKTGDTVRRILFDLGTRSDWATGFSPATLAGVQQLFQQKTSTGEPAASLKVEKDVHTILGEGGVDPDSVEAIVWSHAHLDHVGNPALFGPGTALVVGPNFGPCQHQHGAEGHAHDHKEVPRLLPGYPADPESLIIESDYKGRTFRQLKEDEFTLTLGGFRALDYFGDGSFYLLDTPGHAPGHLCGLARVSTEDGGHFILMAGDGFHHMGELRPSPYRPLPQEWAQSKLLSHFDGAPISPLFTPAGPGHLDSGEAAATLTKLQAWDAHPTVFVVCAHDAHVYSALDDAGLFFPNGTIDDFVARDLVTKTEWAFLEDFAHLK